MTLMVWPFTERFSALPAPMTAAAFFNCSALYPSTFVFPSRATAAGPQSAAAGLAGLSRRMNEQTSPKNSPGMTIKATRANDFRWFIVWSVL